MRKLEIELQHAEVQRVEVWFASKYSFIPACMVGSHWTEVRRAFPQVEVLVTPAGSEPSSRKSWNWASDEVAPARTMSKDGHIGTRKGGIVW